MNTHTLRLSNKTVIDLNKVAYAGFYFSSHTYERFLKPENPTVNGQDVKDELAAPLVDYPGETMLERAKRRKLIDKWVNVTVFILSNGHRLEFTGKKADSLKKAWLAKQ
jgi:hypothetical protein